MDIKTPVVIHLRSRNAPIFEEQRDGKMSLTYCLPGSMKLDGPHKVKLLYVHGAGEPIMVHCGFVQPQGLDRDMVQVLGTSLPHSNVYVPITSSFISQVGAITIESVTGANLRQPIHDLVLALHIVPS